MDTFAYMDAGPDVDTHSNGNAHAYRHPHPYAFANPDTLTHAYACPNANSNAIPAGFLRARPPRRVSGWQRMRTADAHL